MKPSTSPSCTTAPSDIEDYQYFSDEPIHFDLSRLDALKDDPDAYGQCLGGLLFGGPGGIYLDRAVRALRDWIERELITRHGLRKQTKSRPRVASPDIALSLLQDHHLIRDDPRPGGTWWELSHDVLAGPIQEDNRRWQAAHLEAWQVAADDWRRSGRDSSFLLRSRAYLATPPGHRRSELTENEQDFLRESKAAYLAESKLNKYRAQRGIIIGLFVLSLVANVVLILRRVAAGG